MARPQAPLAMLLVLLMLMAGCIYSDTPEWGTGEGQIKVVIDTDAGFNEGHIDVNDAPVYSEEQTENGGDVLAHIKMKSGYSQSWDSIDVRIEANGTEHDCVELAEADAEGLKCTYSYADGDQYWDISEELTISEGANADLVPRDEDGEYILGLIDFIVSVPESTGGKIRVQSKLGSGFSEDIPVTACHSGVAFKVTGLLITSMIYETHNEDDSIESAMGAAVIIDTMSWSDAESVKEGTAGRVPIKDWTSPINPAPAGGSNELKTNAETWEIIGIIPASENIADGLNVLEHWHQPIELTGYILEEGGSGLGAVDTDTCELEDQGHAMVVTNIRTEEGIVSFDGESDDEYMLGDTDVFGRFSFIFFFIAFGIGGGVGLFLVSTMIIRTGAKATAETLLGREGFAKAVQMKMDLKSSKKEGFERAEDRAAKGRENNPPPKEDSAEDVTIPGFSLDNILASGDREGVRGSFSESSSVVITSEAKEMSAKSVANTTTAVTNNAPVSSSNVTSSLPEPAAKKEHFSSSMASSNLPPQQSKTSTPNKPIKRRSVKKRAVKSAVKNEPEPVVENKSASVSDDDDFSDFSL
jgi:hypothetical protein